MTEHHKLPNGKPLTRGNVERWFGPLVAAMKKMASQELSVHLGAVGDGADDGSYDGSYSTVFEQDGRKLVLYSQFVNGVCVQAVSIPFADMESMAMEYVVEPAYVASQSETVGLVRPAIWKPGDN